MPDEEDAITEDIGGVQGADEQDAPQDATAGINVPPPQTPDAPAPDAGEIEWAGGTIRKPPAPAG